MAVKTKGKGKQKSRTVNMSLSSASTSDSDALTSRHNTGKVGRPGAGQKAKAGPSKLGSSVLRGSSTFNNLTRSRRRLKKDAAVTEAGWAHQMNEVLNSDEEQDEDEESEVEDDEEETFDNIEDRSDSDDERPRKRGRKARGA